MKFKAEFTIDNAAFENAEEIPLILKSVANKVSHMSVREQSAETFQVPIQDSNGNRIGYWMITEGYLGNGQ